MYILFISSSFVAVAVVGLVVVHISSYRCLHDLFGPITDMMCNAFHVKSSNQPDFCMLFIIYGLINIRVCVYISTLLLFLLSLFFPAAFFCACSKCAYYAFIWQPRFRNAPGLNGNNNNRK